MRLGAMVTAPTAAVHVATTTFPTNRLLKNLGALGCEGGVVAVVERQLDLEGAVVLKFGGGVARDFVAFIAAILVEEDDSLGVFDLAAGLEGTEGELGAAVVADREMRRLGQIEIVAIPEIGPGDPPPPDDLAHIGAAHGAGPISFGARTKL